MSENAQKPRIRFKGFSDAWEQRKLGDVLQTLPFKAYLKSPEQDGEFEIIQQGNAPIIGYANGEPCKDYEDTVIFGDHTLSLYKPKSPFFVATDGVRIIKGFDNIDGNYLLSLLERNKPQSEGYKRYYSILADIGVFFTENHEEQSKIGEYFSDIDNLITLHQRECFYIYKKYLLFLEMQNSHKRNYSWEQRKLGDYFIERNERNGDGEMISVTINSGIRKFDELNRHDTKPDDLSKYKRVEIGDIAYNSMRMWQGASGYSPYSGILSPAYTVITPKEGVSSRFFAYLIKRPKTIHLFEINSQGLTKDTWNLKFPAFAPIEVKAPVSYEEQVNISRILIQLDNLITLHQCKVFYKNIISKNLKFGGLETENNTSWEQRKLGDVLQTLPFKAYLKSPEQDGEFEIIQQGNAPIIGYANGEPCKDYEDTVIFGDHTLSLYKPKSPFFVATDGVRIIKGFDNIDGNYLLSLLERNKPQSEGYKRYYSILADIGVFFTENHEEQSKIGEYFSDIDNLITLHQRIKIFFTGDYHDKKNK